jgi:tetratricopeptide (TPR) repeat protein
MYCTKCGKQMEDGSQFCIYCGHKLENTESDAPPAKADPTQQPKTHPVKSPTRPKKKKRLVPLVFIILAEAVALAAVAVVCYVLFLSPSARMNRALEQGNIAAAADLYFDHLYGEDLPEKSIALIQTAAARTLQEYTAGALSYEDAQENLRNLEDFGAEGAEKDLSAARQGIEDQYAVKSLIGQAGDAITEEDYAAAIENYSKALERDESNQEAADGLKQAKEALLAQAEKAAGEYLAQGDYEAAVQCLRATSATLQDETLLKSALDRLQQKQIAQISNAARTAAQGGDWDGALEMIDAYTEEYAASPDLEAVRAELASQMPMTLKNLTQVSAQGIEVIKEAVTDRWGNVYDGAVKFEANNDAFGLYNLNGQYTRLTGTVFVSKESSNGTNVSFSVYLDEKLVQHVENITVETAPIALDVDVTGATTLRITTAHTEWPWGELCFANTSLEKAAP